LVFGLGHRDELAHAGPADFTAREGGGDGGEQAEPLGDVCEALHLACGEAQALAREVAEAREAERMMRSAAEKGAREAAEDRAAAGFVACEAAEVAVEEGGSVGPGELAEPGGRRREQEVRRDEIEGRGVVGRGV